MKIVIVTGEPFPNGMAATNRIKCYARAIQEGGMECEVVIFRRPEVYGEKPINTDGVGSFNGIPFRFVGGTPLRGSNALVRQFNDRLDIRRTEKYLKRNLNKGDAIFLFMGGNVELMLRFMNTAHAKGAFCVRDLCELPYGTGAESEKAVRLRKVTIEKQFPKLDGIVSISDALLNLAKSYTLPTCKHVKVPILVDYEQYVLPDRTNEADIPYIFHSGTLSEQKDGILGMIEAFGLALQRLNYPVRFISTGKVKNSKHESEIKDLISRYRLEDKVIFTGYLSDSELKDYLSKASMVIINKYRTQQNNYCFSTKLGEYLAAAKPVIITNVGEAMNWLVDDKSAFIVEPEETTALANAIVRVFSQTEKSRKIGLAGQEVCRECFDYRNWSKPLVEFLNQLGK